MKIEVQDAYFPIIEVINSTGIACSPIAGYLLLA
jgi:hypothetical protein